MPSKRPNRRSRPSPVEDTEDLTLGSESSENVAVMLGGDGAAYFAPRSIREATPRQQSAAARIQTTVRLLGQGQVQLQMQVVDARFEGLSWEAIGWCMGLTGEAVRKRFGS